MYTNSQMPSGNASKTIYHRNEMGRKEGRETITAECSTVCCGYCEPDVNGAICQSTTFTFVIYLCFFCKDVDALVCDLRNILLKAQNGERPVS